MRKSLIVYRKEIIDTMRDSRTVFLTLALPLVLYPVLFSIAGRVQAVNQAHEDRAVPTIAVSGSAHAPMLAQLLESQGRYIVMNAPVDEAFVRDGAVELLIVIPARHEAKVLRGEASVLTVYHDATRSLSRRAHDDIVKVLDDYRVALVESELERRGGSAGIAAASRYSSENIADADQQSAMMLSTMVPYLLVLLIASGASHTAIDATAGEKERSTLETVLVSAASRGEVIFGKFLATWTVSTLSGVMGFAGLVAAALLPASIWRELSGGSLPFTSVVILLGMMLPVSALLSALFLALGCFARGMREGQTFASYVIILVIMLAVLSVMLEVELGTGVFLVPILGTTLAQRLLLSGTGEVLPVLVSVGSTLACAALALLVATRLFSDERVMFRP